MIGEEKDDGSICLIFKNMAYFRIITAVVVLLMAIYYVMVVGQLFGFWKITYRKISFIKLCIPFYYWMVSQKSND